MAPSPVRESDRRIGIPFVLAAALASLAGLVSRTAGREGGALPGKVLLALCPAALDILARRRRPEPIVLVSATNGKTTLTAMVASMLESAGEPVVHNVTGANLRSGIATTLLRARRRRGIAVLEVDEATLPLVAPALQPDAILLGNLFRDQLDRYGELESVADRWREMLDALGTRTSVVYNADDPLIAELVAQAAPGREVVSFGMAAEDVAADGVPHAADSTTCRRCGHPLDYRHSWVGHLGDWSCTACGAERPALQVAATHVDLDGLGGTNLQVSLDTAHGEPDVVVEARLRIPGLYNAYNALGAIAAGSAALGLGVRELAAGIEAFSPAFGRFERIPVPGGGTLTLLLVKNPTGLNEVVRTLVVSGVDLTASLFALNDGVADGRDVSWVWDADLGPLLQRAPALVVTGDRAAEMALRCAYDGFEPDGIILEEDIEQALYRLLERARTFTDHGHAYALVTYTAMLRLRGIVAARGWTRAYWANDPASARGRRSGLRRIGRR